MQDQAGPVEYPDAGHSVHR